MLNTLFNTDSSDNAALIARVFVGLVILPHGLQKLFGMFGGYGFSATLEFFSGSMGIPVPIGFLIIMGESVGAVFLIIGLLSRISGAGLLIIMIGAIFMGHFQHGFFMNWFGNQQGEGFEYHLLVIGLSLIVILNGGGRWSLDGMLFKK